MKSKPKKSFKLNLKALFALPDKAAKPLRFVKKKLQFGNNRSKALNKTPRTWKQNFQRCQLVQNGKKVTVFLPARICKTLKFATKAS